MAREMGEKVNKAVSRNFAIALGIVSIVLVGILIGTIYNYNNVISSKDAQIGTLTNQNNQLNSQITTLQAKINDLQNQIAQKESQIVALQSEISNKEKTIADLNAKIVSLQNEISQRDSQIAELQKQITDLQNQIRDLQDIVQLKKTIILEKDKPVILSNGGSITYSYSTQYAGYIRIDFTATGDVYFMVGSDYTGTYYFRYPSSGTATSGSFLVPVFPGTTYLYIEHPYRFFGTEATITLTITYVY